MARGKQEVQTVAPGEVIGGVTPLAEELAREIRQGLESKTKTLLTHKEPGNMGLKERQKVATDLVVSLFAHPKFQERYVDWALSNLSLIHISEPTRRHHVSRMPSSA